LKFDNASNLGFFVAGMIGFDGRALLKRQAAFDQKAQNRVKK